MPGIKRLRSVAHSFAQHALGPFSPHTPERTLEQRRAALECITVDLMDGSNSTARSLGARFTEFLEKEGIKPADVSEATAAFLGLALTAAFLAVAVSAAVAATFLVAVVFLAAVLATVFLALDLALAADFRGPGEPGFPSRGLNSKP